MRKALEVCGLLCMGMFMAFGVATAFLGAFYAGFLAGKAAAFLEFMQMMAGGMLGG